MGTTTSTKPQKQGQKQGQDQKQGPNLLGHGSFSANMLSSWKAIEKRLAVIGYSQAELDFVYHVAICPKGHDDHINQSAAAKKFFPGVTPITAKCRVLNCLLHFTQQIFTGQHVQKYHDKWAEEHKPVNTTGTRQHLTVEEKATRIATHDLKAGFREENGIGERGRLTPDMQEKLTRYIDKHLTNAIKKITVEIETDNAEK